MSMNVKTIMFLITAGIATLVFGFDMYYKGFDLPQTSLPIIQQDYKMIMSKCNETATQKDDCYEELRKFGQKLTNKDELLK